MRRAQTKSSVRKTLVVCVAACCALAAWQRESLMMVKEAVSQRMARRRTVEERVEQYGGAVRTRLLPFFEKAGVAWPAQRLTFVGLKEERRLAVWGGGVAGTLKLIRIYPVLGASGTSGPKLREGDGQVPEGVYGIESLNPDSAFHLSLRVSYPNAFDRERAKEDGREHLGGDIMIHGGRASAGCLAMGDEAAEDLFVMAALAPLSDIKVILAPCDLRTATPPLFGDIPWLDDLYRHILEETQRSTR
jgi:hypothetical protein